MKHRLTITLMYNNAGSLQWELGYNSKYNLLDSPSDIAVCTDGGIVVAGQAARADESWSYATMKYRYRDFVIPADSDSVSTSLRWIANNDQLINTDGDPVERVRYYSN